MRSDATRAEELRAQLEHHNRRYYELDDPEIGDDEYDALLNELREIEERNPELRTPDSPTQRVGARPLERFEQVEHAEPMLSLANARNEDELRAWEARVRNLLKRYDITAEQISYTTEPKIDGLAISFTYEDGELTRAATRGDGRIGEDVLRNLRARADVVRREAEAAGREDPLEPMPLRIEDAPGLIEVRGEVYLPIEAFTELNEKRASAGESTFGSVT